MGLRWLSVSLTPTSIHKLYLTTLTLLANPLSISHISSSTDGIDCTFHGVDNSVTSVSGVASVDVGPPQTQVSGTCSKLWRRDTPQVAVSFIGAADAKFGQNFPLDGSAVQISKSS